MRAKIGRFEVEGTAEEMAALLAKVADVEVISDSDLERMALPKVTKGTEVNMPHNPTGIKYTDIFKGQPVKILTELFTENPELANKPLRLIRKAYLNKTGARNCDYDRLRINIEEAKRLSKNSRLSRLAKARWSKKKAAAPVQEKEHIRVIRAAYVSRQLVEDIIRSLPDTFSMRDVMSRIAVKMNLPFDKKRFIYYHSAYRWIIKICGPPYIRSHKQGIFKNPYKKGGQASLDSALKLSPAEDTKPAFVQDMEKELPYEPVIISRETLDNIVSSHMSFGADSLIGYKSKTNVVLTDRDATYCFKHLLENFSAFQKLYPDRKMSISGSGRYRTIEVRA